MVWLTNSTILIISNWLDLPTLKEMLVVVFQMETTTFIPDQMGPGTQKSLQKTQKSLSMLSITARIN